mgnify:CR=1 FL=1
MKKYLKSMLTITMAAVMSVPLFGFAACGDDHDVNYIPDDQKKNMSELRVHIFNGGIGIQWAKEIAAGFQTLLKDVSFEEGKTGVYVTVDGDKPTYTELAQNMSNGNANYDIYYTCGIDIYDYLDYNVAYDVTDILNEKVYDASGAVQLAADGKSFVTQESNKSMLDRMLPYFQTAYNIADEVSSDPEYSENLGAGDIPSEAEGGQLYCAVPYEDSLAGIMIDYDLYEELVKKFGLEMTGYKYEDYDVPMPGTWEEYWALMDEVRNQNKEYSGFLYSIDYYTPPIERAIMADVDGSDQYRDIYTDWMGTYESRNGTTVEITPDTMWKMTEADGYKEVVEQISKLFSMGAEGDSNSNYYDPAVKNGVSFGGAQMRFIQSKDSGGKFPRVLSILEGDWWENEARGYFGDTYGERRFCLMPIPHAYEEDAGNPYMVGGYSSGFLSVVNKKTVEGNETKETLIKLWLQYMHAMDGLEIFTRNSSSVLPFVYERTDLEGLTPFANSILELHTEDMKDEDSRQIEIIRANTISSPLYVRNATSNLGFATTIDNTTFGSGAACETMRQIRLNQTIGSQVYTANLATFVNKYLAGSKSYYESNWTTIWEG